MARTVALPDLLLRAQVHLDGLRQRDPRSYHREIRAANGMLAALRWSVIRGFANRCFLLAVEEALRRLGGPLDFAEQHCRVLLGTQIAAHATFLAAVGAGENGRGTSWEHPRRME